ncbi:acetate--CoA ligase family protein [Halovivax gelatinilyticus]|uniref:acetate--CoA ligase family protein n=1 Tax=Halovivax gelatinilyticus TaxID=2961597 RepID=UPI0020CA6790|nr:acetate--CoA ligase [Halovivax gelatinilyticus]
MGDLSPLFDPDAVAVIGATDRDGSVGRAITENLQDEFDGAVVPVNPSREEVLGLPCVQSLEAGPPVDLAVVVVPPDAAVDAVRDAGRAGVENVVVITAGFGETGSEGANRERRLRELAAEYELSLVGPNSLGIMSTPAGLNATFGPEIAREGSISLMSQSGAFITAVLDWASEQDVGFRHVVSLGNKAVLDESDFVRAWGSDPETDVVIGYLESIVDGESFLEATREVTTDTPVVIVKAGRTAAGAKAASSHTGAIAGSERAYRAGLAQAGVIRAESVQELFDAARALSGLTPPDSDGVAVVTNAGGPGVLTTDAVGDADLSIARFTDETSAALEASMPAEANTHNPIDVIGDATVERFETALDLALADPNVGSAVVVSAPTAVLAYEDLAAAIVDCQRRHGKPIVTSLMGGSRTGAADRVLREAGIPNYFDPARAVGGLDALSTFGRTRKRTLDEPTRFDVDEERAREILNRATERSGTQLGVESMDLLEAYGIPTPPGSVVTGPDEALAVASELGEEVVMKLVSPDISHKSDIGGVAVGVALEDVPDTYETLLTRARNYQPDATVLGVQVQEQLDLDDSTETIVGVNRDPQFGPLLVFGLGGIFVEVLDDTAVRVAPIGRDEAASMVEEIRANPLLRGARGREPADIDAIVETIQRLSQLVTTFPAILELDVNPLVAGPDGVQAIDLRVTVDTEKL